MEIVRYYEYIPFSFTSFFFFYSIKIFHWLFCLSCSLIHSLNSFSLLIHSVHTYCTSAFLPGSVLVVAMQCWTFYTVTSFMKHAVLWKTSKSNAMRKVLWRVNTLWYCHVSIRGKMLTLNLEGPGEFLEELLFKQKPEIGGQGRDEMRNESVKWVSFS